MFCSKCGAEAKEGAVFCEKCGARLSVAAGNAMEERSVQTDMCEIVEPMASEALKTSEEGAPETSRSDKPTVSEPQKFTEPVRQATSETSNTVGPISAGDVYILLQENASNCPEIQKVTFQQEMGITMLKGNKNRYFVGFSRGDYRLSVCPKFLLSIHRVLFWFVILVTVSLLVQGIDAGEIYPLLGWCLLIGGVGGILSEVICKKEKRKVVTFIKETLSKTVCIKEPVAPVIEPLLSHPRLWFLGFSLPKASMIMPIVYSLVALGGTVVLMIGSGVLDHTGTSSYDTYNDRNYDRDDNESETDRFTPSEDIHVLGVKGGTPVDYPGKTYGEAFENFFGSPTWKYFVGTKEGADEDGDGRPDYIEKNVEIVEFTGRCLYQDVEVTALIQFTLNEEDDTFEATYLSFNEVPQSMYMLSVLLETVFMDGDMDAVIAAPMLHDFVNVTDHSNPWGDGWMYEISWDSVDGAKGYEVEYTETESFNEGEGYHDVTEVEENVFSVSGSVEVKITIRVRAYAEENGERVYGEWSEPRSAVLDYDDSEGTRGYFGDHTSEYVGTWWDTYSQRCNMKISSYDGASYDIDINWSSSASENTHWSFYGTYDEMAGGIRYYGSRIEESYLDNGEMQETYVYSDGEGFIWVGDDGMLYWDDHVEQQGADCSFEKSIE